MDSSQIVSLQVSVVITTHSEGTLLIPCIRSVFNSIEIAKQHNIYSEVIIVCDTANSETVSTLNNLSGKFIFTTLHTNYSNPGEARNAGIKATSGKFIGVVDGDDLVSGNWILNSFLTAVDSVNPAVFHPELILSFGKRPSIFRMKSTITHPISYLEIIENNLWASPVFGSRIIFEEYPYRNLQGKSGFGPEDWTWNLELMSAGIHHGIAKRTFYLYRTSDVSGVNSTHSQSLLPFLKIDQLRKHFLHRSVEFEENQHELNPNSRIRRIVTSTYYSMKWLFKPLLALSPKLSRKIYLGARRVYAYFINQPVSSLQSFQIENRNPIVELSDEDFRIFSKDIASLAWLEPQASWPVVEHSVLPVWDPKPSSYGEILEDFCGFLFGEQQTCVIFVPWVGIGGADLVSMNYAKAFRQKFVNSRVIIAATMGKEHTNQDLIPEGVEFYQFPIGFQELDPGKRAKLLAQSIVEINPQIVLNVNSPDFFESLRNYSLPMSQRTNLYFTFFCFDHSIEGVPIHHAFESSREYLSNVRGIFTDNDVVRRQLIEMFGFEESFVHSHHAPFEFLGNKATLENIRLSQNEQVKLLWAHRIDRQKRPDVLNRIVQALNEEGFKVQIDLYGKSVLNEASTFNFDGSIKLFGEFTGGLYGIDTSSYDAFLVTSEWEGLPTVLLQAVDLGLPIIATNVGGISDVVMKDTSGYLVKSPEDIDGFVDAIKHLHSNPKQASKMANMAKTIIRSQHSWDQFQASVDRDIKPFRSEISSSKES